MLNRRGFLKRLAAVPLIPLVAKVDLFQKHLELETGCDLSMTALQEAINVGAKNQLGRPTVLVVPPELRWIAREILGDPPRKKYTADSEINVLWDHILTYKVVYSREEYRRYRLPVSQSSWRLFFEKGSVGSVGP